MPSENQPGVIVVGPFLTAEWDDLPGCEDGGFPLDAFAYEQPWRRLPYHVEWFRDALFGDRYLRLIPVADAQPS